MADTTIYIGGIAIHEPVTVFTDCIIMLLCFIFFKKLKPIDDTVKYWRLFFLFLGISTIVGAFSHAFYRVHEGIGYKTFWLGMQLINGIAVYFAQKATLSSVLKKSRFYNFWKWSYLIQLFAFFIAVLVIQKFLVTVVDNILGLLPIIIIHFETKRKKAYYKYIGYGMSISFIAGVVHATKSSIHEYLNYNDIAHLIIMASLTVIYIGVKKRLFLYQ